MDTHNTSKNKTSLLGGFCNFSGRANRSEYIKYTLGIFTIQEVILFLFNKKYIVPNLASYIVILVLGIVLFLFLLGATVRRLNDMNKSQWLALFLLLPYIQLLFVFILCAHPGSPTAEADENTALKTNNSTDSKISHTSVSTVAVIAVITNTLLYIPLFFLNLMGCDNPYKYCPFEEASFVYVIIGSIPIYILIWYPMSERSERQRKAAIVCILFSPLFAIAGNVATYIIGQNFPASLKQTTFYGPATNSGPVIDQSFLSYTKTESPPQNQPPAKQMPNYTSAVKASPMSINQSAIAANLIETSQVKQHIFWGRDGRANLGSGDWIYGSYKGECGINQAVTGLSRSASSSEAHKILCGDNAAYQHNTCYTLYLAKGYSEDYGTSDGKVIESYLAQCGKNDYVAGVSQTTSGMINSVLCCSGAVSRSRCEPQKIDNLNGQDQTRPDWDVNYLKGQCNNDQYVAGISRDINTGSPNYLLCCSP